MFPSLPAVRQLVRAEDIVRAAWKRCFPFAAGCCCFDSSAPCWLLPACSYHELTQADDATHRRAAHQNHKEGTVAKKDDMARREKIDADRAQETWDAEGGGPPRPDV